MNEQIRHRQFLLESDGNRIPLFDRIGIPRGWVIDGKLNPEYLGKIKAFGYSS